MSDYNNEQEFDLNDPNLSIEVPEGYDPEGELVAASFAPPKDGENRVWVWLIDDKEDRETGGVKKAVRFSKGKIVAGFRVQFLKEDGSPGQYAKDWYVTSQVFEGQVTSALATLCKLAGAPVKTVNAQQYIAHVNTTFKKFTEGDGFPLNVRTQWVRQTSDGAGGYGPDIKGMKKVAAAALMDAQKRAAENGWDEDQTAVAVAYAQQNPHLYYDDSNEERSVRAEVRGIVGA